MAINIKELVAGTMLELVKRQTLESITIKDILEASKISRQTFYNHFQDKDDLIHYIYDHIIIPNFNEADAKLNFYGALLVAFENMKNHHTFMKQACIMEGQNCLKDHIFEHCRDFDLKWHQELYGDAPMPDELVFATIYHATASSSMTLSWVLANMPVPCEEIALMIVKMRGLGMEELFAKGKTKGNPYAVD